MLRFPARFAAANGPSGLPGVPAAGHPNLPGPVTRQRSPQVLFALGGRAHWRVVPGGVRAGMPPDDRSGEVMPRDERFLMPWLPLWLPAQPNVLTPWQSHDKKVSSTDQRDAISRGPHSADLPRLASWKTDGKIVAGAHY